MDLQSFKIEYLVIIDTRDSFCSNLSSFNNLIKSNSEITINSNVIKYRGLNVEYSVQTEELSDSNQRYFHLKLKISNTVDISIFEDLLKNIRVILAKAASAKVETLWDDISFYYANKAYPLIHQIENLMRKLITKFMLTNVGIGWTKEAIPDVVKESVKRKGKEKPENSPDYLYETDFIQLANFLFEPYQSVSSEKLTEKLKSISNVNELTLDDLMLYVPKSNWERYFSNIVECEHEFLEKRWKRLYELRCKIAHNNRMNKDDFLMTEKLVLEIKEKLQSAIDNLDKITISSEDKESIAESMVKTRNELTGRFIASYKNLEEAMVNLLENKGLLKKGDRLYTSRFIRLLHEHNIISVEMAREIQRYMELRSHIVHSNDINIDQEVLSLFVKKIEDCTRNINSIMVNVIDTPSEYPTVVKEPEQ